MALARAFSNRPKILFADEPTGNLDGVTGAKVIEIMLELNRELGTTTMLVTHDAELARRTGRIIRLADGAMISDERVVPEAEEHRGRADREQNED